MKRTLLCCMLLLGLTASMASAHPAEFTESFGDTGYGSALYKPHEDSDPFKGWVTVTATNTSDTAWGSFHFFIFSTGQDVSNLDFLEGEIELINYDPQSSQSPLTWVIDNTPATGSTAVLNFFDDPVLPTETATFQVFTNNVDQINFGVGFYPAPVPEPATMALLGTGLALVIVRRRRNTVK